MKHIKDDPPELCEYFNLSVPYSWHTSVCGKPAKYEWHFTDPKAKPMRLCGVHGNQAKRRGFIVKLIGQ